MSEHILRRRAFIVVEHALAWLACTLVFVAFLPIELAVILNFAAGVANGMIAMTRWATA